MPVQKIARKEFVHLYPGVKGLTPFIGDAEDVEWFTDDARSVLGLIFRSKRQPIWRYAVLKRSQRGDFRVSQFGAEFIDLQSTRDQCRRAIMAAEWQPDTGDDRVLVSTRQLEAHLEKKHWGNLVVVALIVIGDLVTVGVVLLMFLRCFR